MALLFSTYARAADDTSDTHIRAALAASGDAAKLIVTNGGKKPGVSLAIGKGKPTLIYGGEAAATIEAGHGIVVIAVSIDSAKKPFQIVTLVDGKLGKPVGLARGNQRQDYPFAIAATATPDGFTVFFQEVATNDPSEAHTYMVKLDKAGAVTDEPKEVAIPWALAAAAWNGSGYHLALFYTGGGTRLSMVSTSADGQPQGHPDWATQPGNISDVHLVASDKQIRAIYRGTGGRLNETDVTKIGQWGQVTEKTRDIGELAANTAIAITAKGAVSKIATK
jgi:hypothetical protein